MGLQRKSTQSYEMFLANVLELGEPIPGAINILHNTLGCVLHFATDVDLCQERLQNEWQGNFFFLRNAGLSRIRVPN